MAASKLRRLLPWIQEPLIVSAPMRPYARHALATKVTLSGGLGFIPNCNQTADTKSELESALHMLKTESSTSEELRRAMKDSLPVGLGYQIYQESLDEAIDLIREFKPVAVWLFAARKNEDYAVWAQAIREASPKSSLWIQVGTVTDALAMVELCGQDIVLVMQGSDAGGHGLQHSAGLITLIPETIDTVRQYDIPVLAAGGISEGRGAAAALILGADGIVLGTRLLASKEATIPAGFLQHILDSKDGGLTTRRTRLFDNLRGTGDFPDEYDGRALINQSIKDAEKGITEDESTKKYREALKSPGTGFGPEGRLVSYAGTGIGLIKEVKPTAEIIEEVRSDAIRTLDQAREKALSWKQ